MTKYTYTRQKNGRKKRVLRAVSVGIIGIGILVMAYVFLPLISWQLYFAPVFAQEAITVPIPKATVLTEGLMKSLLTETLQKISGVDDTDASTWFPTYKAKGVKHSVAVASYSLSIPTLNIDHATVSTIDTDLAHHLVNYEGTAIPAEKGNAVILGHSTLPQLFNQHDYTTIFATAYLLKPKDAIVVHIQGITYTYSIYQIFVTDPNDASIFNQNYLDSELTLVTCTPPGTIWKRLIIKARLETI